MTGKALMRDHVVREGSYVGRGETKMLTGTLGSGRLARGDVLRDAAAGAFQDTCLCAPPPPPRPQIRGCD